MVKYWQHIDNIHLKAFSVALPIALIFYVFGKSLFILVVLGLIFGSIGLVIYFVGGWIKYFINRKNRLPEPKDPYLLAIENSNNKSELPEFCIILKNLPPKFVEMYFYVYVVFILVTFYFIHQFFTTGIDVFDLKGVIYVIGVFFLLKHWDKLLDEHNNRLNVNDELPNPHLQITHESIVYFDGKDEFVINWQDVQDIDLYDASTFAKSDIIIKSNNQVIHISGYYETISIYDIYDMIYDYEFIVKNNRKRLKIT